MKIQLEHKEIIDENSPEHIALILLTRFGLVPRKKDGTAELQKLLLELYERKKKANRERQPQIAVIPVDEMAAFAGISRQTMYEYLHRWIDLAVLKKTTFVANGKVVIGYELNGQNIEGAFRKAEVTIRNHLEYSFKLIEMLQKEIKKEKIIETITSNRKEDYPKQQDSSLPVLPETNYPASNTPDSLHNASK